MHVLVCSYVAVCVCVCVGAGITVLAAEFYSSYFVLLVHTACSERSYIPIPKQPITVSDGKFSEHCMKMRQMANEAILQNFCMDDAMFQVSCKRFFGGITTSTLPGTLTCSYY